MNHSHECRDCGHSIPCNGVEDRHGACLRWDGGNDGCDECNGPMPAYRRRTYYSGTTDSNGTHCCSNCGRTLDAHSRGQLVGILRCPTDY